MSSKPPGGIPRAPDHSALFPGGSQGAQIGQPRACRGDAGPPHQPRATRAGRLRHVSQMHVPLEQRGLQSQPVLPDASVREEEDRRTKPDQCGVADVTEALRRAH